jgi:RNA polymerase sigma factor (sigma-70 family)
MSTNQDLLKYCLEGDRKAQYQLYKHYAAKLLVVAWRYTKNKEDAEDVLQEAFVKIFRSLSKFKGESSLETWMRKIVVNTALNHQRGKLYMFPMVVVEDLNEGDQPLNFDQFSGEEIMQLVNQLPEGCRIVFNLYAIEGYKHKEIGELLKINEGTSKSQYARARKLLEDELGKLEGKRKIVE